MDRVLGTLWVNVHNEGICLYPRHKGWRIMVEHEEDKVLLWLETVVCGSNIRSLATSFNMKLNINDNGRKRVRVSKT